MRVCAIVVMCLAACGSESDQSASDDSDADLGTGALKSSSDAQKSRAYNPASHYHKYDIAPSAVDGSITTAWNNHQAFYPRVTPIGKLVVFMPGTNGAPGHEDAFMAAAADLGYHGINLSYPTDVAASAACRTDVSCYGPYRHEMFTGVDYSPVVDVQPQDSIHDRLLGLIWYLMAAHPREHWDSFVNGNNLFYPAIVFSGLSQGGGHAAWAGVNHRTAGVIMFSSVDDANHQSTPVQPATWVDRAHLTPISRYYGFDHDDDYERPAVAVNWPALGMDVYGGRTPTDGVAAPYGGSHELSTALPVDNALDAHEMVVSDVKTPHNADGSPMYEPVWKYMLGALL